MPPNSNKRIVKNTLALYFRMLITTIVSLYSIRIVLNEFGVEDFGVYSVVAGVVTLASFLPGSMASATQRFFSFALGENDLEKLKKTFSVNSILYCIIAVIAFLLLETVGLWFVNEYLQVPAESLDAIRRLYHFSILTLVAGIFTSPFVAMIIAHEDMKIYAYISIVEALMKLCAAFLLTYLSWNKLELYGFLLLVVAFVNAAAYIVFCFIKYEECQLRKFYWDKVLLQEIISFTGWTLFGQISTVVRGQAVTILLNQNFNPGVVAARAVSVSVASKVNIFSQNFNTGLYPPIIKAYAADNKSEMFSFIYNGSKITFFLMWIFALPLFLEMEFVLTLWLKEPPAGSVLFVRLALIESLIFSVSMPLTTAARAPGKMKFYELALGIMQLTIFPISWFVLKIGYEAYSVFIVAIGVNVLMFFFRLHIVHGLIGISMAEFIKKVVVPVCGVILLSSILSFLIEMILPEGVVFSLVAIIFAGLVCLICIYFIGLDKFWREKLQSMVVSKVRKLQGNL